MGKLLLSLILGALTIHAADPGYALRPAYSPLEPVPARFKSGRTLWRASVTALAAVNVMDMQSSWGKRELNPYLAGNGGTFGAKGALLKSGVAGGVVALEYLVLRHHGSKSLYRALAVVNFGDAAVTGSMAGRNWGVAGR